MVWKLITFRQDINAMMLFLLAYPISKAAIGYVWSWLYKAIYIYEIINHETFSKWLWQYIRIQRNQRCSVLIQMDDHLHVLKLMIYVRVYLYTYISLLYFGYIHALVLFRFLAECSLVVPKDTSDNPPIWALCGMYVQCVGQAVIYYGLILMDLPVHTRNSILV